MCDIIRQYHPIYVNTHFNHPREVTPEAGLGVCPSGRCGGADWLSDRADGRRERRPGGDEGAGAEAAARFACGRTTSTRPTSRGVPTTFGPRVEKGLEIIKALRGWTSGLAVPHFVIDAPWRRRENTAPARVRRGNERRRGGAAELPGQDCSAIRRFRRSGPVGEQSGNGVAAPVAALLP